jgi:hypothetical protein
MAKKRPNEGRKRPKASPPSQRSTTSVHPVGPLPSNVHVVPMILVDPPRPTRRKGAKKVD